MNSQTPIPQPEKFSLVSTVKRTLGEIKDSILNAVEGFFMAFVDVGSGLILGGAIASGDVFTAAAVGWTCFTTKVLIFYNDARSRRRLADLTEDMRSFKEEAEGRLKANKESAQQAKQFDLHNERDMERFFHWVEVYLRLKNRDKERLIRNTIRNGVLGNHCVDMLDHTFGKWIEEDIEPVDALVLLEAKEYELREGENEGEHDSYRIYSGDIEAVLRDNGLASFFEDAIIAKFSKLGICSSAFSVDDGDRGSYLGITRIGWLFAEFLRDIGGA